MASSVKCKVLSKAQHVWHTFIKSAFEHQYTIKSLTISLTASIIQHFQTYCNKYQCRLANVIIINSLLNYKMYTVQCTDLKPGSNSLHRMLSPLSMTCFLNRIVTTALCFCLLVDIYTGYNNVGFSIQ
jgi:hypothetical protein